MPPLYADRSLEIHPASLVINSFRAAASFERTDV